MPTAVAIQYLSWNNARILALILNSLTGLVSYFDADVDSLTVNELFGVRMAQTALQQLDAGFSANGLNKEIFSAIRNLSKRADMLVVRGTDRLGSKNADLANEVGGTFIGVWGV
jgi:hypothetical protein